MLGKKAWSFACKDARLGAPKYLLWSLCLVQWFSAYQYHHHLELYKICKFLGHTQDLLHQKLWRRAQQCGFNKTYPNDSDTLESLGTTGLNSPGRLLKLS